MRRIFTAMFKSSILYLLLLMVPAVAHAQNFFSTEEEGISRVFYGGFAGGLNFTQVDGDSYAGYHKVGLNAGGMVYVRFSDRVGLCLELAYSQKGARVKESGTNIYGVGYLNDYKLKLNYVEVPLMFYFVTNSKVHIKLGASYARLFSSTEEAYANYQVNIDPALYTFRKQDISYTAEIDYMFYKGWFAGFRYTYSIASIRDADKIPVGYGFGAAGQFNNSFSLRLMHLLK